MQDSLEDYLTITKNIKLEQKPIKQEVLISIQRKKECNAKAIQIVEFAIDGKLKSETLFKCLPYINQSFYQDIVEERALTKLCGYPVCGKTIPEMPKKQYFISTKNNQVYDITDRKNFCSNFCYSASAYIKYQIDDSPLWLRKFDEVKQFHLMPKCEKGLPGEKIDQGIAKPVECETNFTSVSQFAQLSLNEVEENKIKPQKSKRNDKKCVKTLNTISEELENDIEPVQEKIELLDNKQKFLNSKQINKINRQILKKDKVIKEVNNVGKLNVAVEHKRLKVIQEKTEPLENKVEVECKKNNEQTIKQEKKKRKKEKIDIENTIKKYFNEWLTIKSLIFIHGELKMNEYIKKYKLENYLKSIEINNLTLEQQKKYVEICRNLNLQQITDEKFHNSSLKLVNYKEIKEETRNLDLKVKSFYSGSLLNENSTIKITENVKNDEQDDDEILCLPLVDTNSQITLRRKILLNSLNKTLENLLEILRIDSREILVEVQEFVKTFNLKADNIVFKPIVLNFMCIVFLKILCLKNKKIENLLQEGKCDKYLEKQLDLLPHKSQFVLDIVEMINNIEDFVSVNK